MAFALPLSIMFLLCEGDLRKFPASQMAFPLCTPLQLHQETKVSDGRHSLQPSAKGLQSNGRRTN